MISTELNTYTANIPFNSHLDPSTNRRKRKIKTDLAVVDTDNTANHLGDDNHVTEMGLDDGGLLIWWGLLLGLAELLDETHRLTLQTTLEPPAGTSVHQLERPKLSDQVVLMDKWRHTSTNCKIIDESDPYINNSKIHTSSLLKSKSLSSSTPRYENERKVLFFLSSAATAGSVTDESA